MRFRVDRPGEFAGDAIEFILRPGDKVKLENDDVRTVRLFVQREFLRPGADRLPSAQSWPAQGRWPGPDPKGIE